MSTDVAPRPRHDAPSTAPATADQAAVVGPPPSILVADDDPIVRDVWTAALRQAGFQTAAARDGTEALEGLQTLLPDLLILDLRMPELSGPAVLEMVRQRPALARVRVLIISGFLDEEPVPEHGLRIVGRLPKPQSLQAMVAAVRAGLLTPPGEDVGATHLSPPDPFDPLIAALAEAVTHLQAWTDPSRDRLVGPVTHALVQLRAIAGSPAWHGSAAPVSATGGAWLHDVFDSVTVVAGWARILDPAGDPARLARAVDAIGRNARRLLDLLGRAPV
jgi:CheY-like chemotaxis protein